MRRTITRLLFLAAGGLAFAAQAAAQTSSSGNWQYYAASATSYRISDDDDAETTPAAAAAATPKSAVATAVGRPQLPGQERNALYMSDGTGLRRELMRTNFVTGNGDCGCGQGSCLSDCCNDCDCSVNSFRFEYLMWFSRGRNTPPLVTTSPVGTPAGQAGVLGFDTTSIIFGNDPIGTGIRNGGRFTFSHLFNDGITYGDVRFWGVEDSSQTFAINSTNNPIIARPLFNSAANVNGQDSFVVAYPGIADPGQIRVLSKNDLIGADAWLRRNWYSDCCGSIDILGGYQFTRLDDTLQISSTQTSVSTAPGALPVGTVVNVFDSFRTQNEFHGGTLGLLARSYRGPVTLEALAKMGLGNMHQSVIIAGNTTVNGSQSVGGLLAQATNIGTFERNRIAFVPELNVNLLYDVTPSWRLIGGYSFIYWSNVVLAGNQIDTTVDGRLLTGNPLLTPATNPALRFARSDFWIQGLSAGAEYRW